MAKAMSSTSAVGTTGALGATAGTGATGGPPSVPPPPAGSNAGTGGIAPAHGFQESLEALLQGIQKVIPAGSTIPSQSGGWLQTAVISQLGVDPVSWSRAS
jgi:hypothetical protein